MSAMCPYLSAANLIALGSLVVGAVGLYFLVQYVGYTRRISEEAVRQTEASFKPAIIAIPTERGDKDCTLRNVGKGPAMDVEWQIMGTNQKGRFSCVEAGADSPPMHPSNLEALVNAALKSPSKNDVAIVCSYKSISGKQYTSVSKHVVSDHGPETDRFDTTFGG
jgi:hypothetical protein